jgi:hypothetical protein
MIAVETAAATVKENANATEIMKVKIVQKEDALIAAVDMAHATRAPFRAIV